MRKDKVIEVIKDMPQDFELDALFERLVVIEKLEEAARQVEEGKVVYHSEAKKRADEWKK
ncbi:MAG TPA: hypothetical protein VEB40_06285 [Flavipsychrobacter sp.]|nr:hypothetical protein [Flavipsychrobacter sp.]